jgi:hypothetical protein
MKKHKPKQRVKGYWWWPSEALVAKGVKRKWVKGYLRKRPSKATLKRAAKKRAATIALRKPFKYAPHHRGEDRYRLYYTWKVLALVPPGYIDKFWRASEDPDAADVMKPIYMHTPFTETKEEANLNLQRLIHASEEKHGSVEWQTFTLYLVGGPGPITEKHWSLVETHLDVDSLPVK